VGGTVTGDTSGANGSITAVNIDVGGTSGCLDLGNLSGNFQSDEILTGSIGGSATVNGLLFDSGEGFQNVITYTVGFMGDKEGDLFLINTSNNGNGNKDLYDTSDEDYGKYHFNADSPDELSAQLLAAVNSILSRTSTFMAPVVPVTRTTSGDRIYMAFFKPNKGNFWEGNVTKYGISSDNQIVDKNGNPATWPNGALKVDAVPYWATIDWADNTKSNYIHNSNRKIYTYLNSLTQFESTNANLTATILGNPTRSPADIINYVRGADVLDEDGDTDDTENRSIITGDVLHSEPSIFQYRYADGTAKTMVYFGSNDGMLHAVLDATESSGVPPTVTTYGTEEWAFIPPDQLPRLKEMIEGVEHQSYVDTTPKIYFKDIDRDGVVDTGDGDKVILVCGERKGGTGYFALNVTDPSTPLYLWRINQYDDAEAGKASPTTVIAELGESWSEPQFGVVKTSDGDMTGTPVFFIGGGYSSDNSSGKAVIAVNILTGVVVKKFTAGMNYSFPSAVLVVDENDNGFVDKVYVGDLGGQMWRFASFTDSGGNPLSFPNCNENINSWTEQVFFKTDDNNSRKFFYPPSVTLEKGYDMVFIGTGDRENACCNNSNNLCSFTGPDIIAAVKETHSATTIVGEEDSGGLIAKDLVDVTDPAATPPNLSTSGDVDLNLYTDQGWYVRLVDDIDQAVGEKVLAQGVVFYKTFYITTFTPNDDPCVPGGDGKLYALSHLTGSAVLDFDNDSNSDRSTTVGGGIPSKPVMLITKTGTKLLVSVGSANPDAASPSTGAGIRNINPLLPPINFFYKYWKEVF
jgi:type IV pilus assembly protein PilY1